MIDAESFLPEPIFLSSDKNISNYKRMSTFASICCVHVYRDRLLVSAKDSTGIQILQDFPADGSAEAVGIK